MIKKVIAGVLEIAYLEIGPSNGALLCCFTDFPTTCTRTMRSQGSWPPRGSAASSRIYEAMALQGF